MSIWDAAEAGDLAEVQRLVGQELGLLNAKDPYKWTPLMRAADEGHVDVVRWLVDQGANVNESSPYRSTALGLASCEGHTPVVQLLLERGADPAIANNGRTPVMEASARGQMEAFRCLLDHPSAAATINHRDRCGMTALWLACGFSHGRLLKLLLERGADPTIATNSGSTPMARAKLSDFPACVEALEVRMLASSVPSSRLLTGITDLRRGVLSLSLAWRAGGGAGLPALEGQAGGRPAGQRRGSGAEGAGGLGSEEDEGAAGLRVAPSEGGPVPGADGHDAVRYGG
jgi:hypothetical protein